MYGPTTSELFGFLAAIAIAAFLLGVGVTALMFEVF